jgi:hypothetical protein
LTRPEHIVHFFRDVHGLSPITKDALAKRTQEYQQWVEAHARTHRIPIEWPDAEPLKTKKLKREDYVRPYGQRMERQKRFGVYFIFKGAPGVAIVESNHLFSQRHHLPRACRRAGALRSVARTQEAWHAHRSQKEWRRCTATHGLCGTPLLVRSQTRSGVPWNLFARIAARPAP